MRALIICKRKHHASSNWKSASGVILLCFQAVLLGLSTTSPLNAEERYHQPTSRVATTFIPEVEISIAGSDRVITSNGIPASNHGTFPNPHNPHSISPQLHEFRVPLNPTLASEITPVEFSLFGVALDGVPFDPGTAEYWNGDRYSGWRYEALTGAMNLGLDENHAHVQPQGAYHYHGLPTGLVEQLGAPQQMQLIGYAADGFPIYSSYGHENPNDLTSPVGELKSSYVLKSGQRISGPGGTHNGTFVQDYEYRTGAGDLDECNGRIGVTPDSARPTYHYYVTTAFPFVPRCWRGVPDRSFRHRPLANRPEAGQRRGPQPPPQHPPRMETPPHGERGPFSPPGRPPGPPLHRGE